jgi:hypothetical protein
MVLVQGMDNQRRIFIGLGSEKESFLMLANAISVDQINWTYFCDSTILIDVMDSSLGEFSHVKDSTFLVLWIVAQPIEEVEFWVDGERGRPLTNNRGSLEVVNLKLVVGWRVVQNLLSTDLGEPVWVDTQYGRIVFVFWEFSLVHYLTSESVPHNVVPRLWEDEENVVWESVGLNMFCLER